MGIKIGNTDTGIGNAFVGSTPLGAIFCGSHLVWSAGIKIKSVLTPKTATTTTSGIKKEMVGDSVVLTGTSTGSSWVELGTYSIIENHKYLFVDLADISSNARNYYYSSGISIFRTKNTINTATRTITTSFYYVNTDTVNEVNITIPHLVVIDLTVSKLEQFTADQLYNLITLNGTDFANLGLLANGYEVKCGAFKVENNAIKGTKYGIVDLGDLVWSYQSGHQRFSSGTLASVIKPCDAGVIPNLYAEGFVAEKLNNMSVGGTDKSMSVYTNSYVFAKDAGYTDATLFRNSLKGKYLLYELATSLGNKLDNLNAEQAYNLLVGTMPSTKLPYPNGRTLEMNGNAIKGTKYGIVDLGTLVWGRNSGTIWKYANITELGTPQYGTSTVANIYCQMYKTDYAATSPDGSISIFSGGGQVYLRISDSRFDDTQLEDFKNAIQGVHMVFELATPDGDSYADLNAKQMFGLLGENNATKLLSNGEVLIGGK